MGGSNSIIDKDGDTLSLNKRKELLLKPKFIPEKWKFLTDVDALCLFLYLGLRFPNLNSDCYGWIKISENNIQVKSYITIKEISIGDKITIKMEKGS